MTITHKIASGVATTGLLLSSLVPAAFADVTISGNGSRSENEVDADYSVTTVISQSNDFTVDNNVQVSNNTGENSASGNTGGDVAVDSGDAEANVEIHNMGNTNVATIDSCGDCNALANSDIRILGNGTQSENKVDLDFDKTLVFEQDNDADFDNNVWVDNNTGDNTVRGNTGGGFWGHPTWDDHMWLNHHNDWWNDHGMWMHHMHDWQNSNEGDVEIETGDAEANVMLHNEANKNMLHVN